MKMEENSLMSLSNVSAQQLWNYFLIQTHRVQITLVLPLVTSLYLGISSEVNEPLSTRGSNQRSSGSDVTAGSRAHTSPGEDTRFSTGVLRNKAQPLPLSALSPHSRAQQLPLRGPR